MNLKNFAIPKPGDKVHILGNGFAYKTPEGFLYPDNTCQNSNCIDCISNHKNIMKFHSKVIIHGEEFYLLEDSGILCAFRPNLVEKI